MTSAKLVKLYEPTKKAKSFLTKTFLAFRAGVSGRHKPRPSSRTGFSTGHSWLLGDLSLVTPSCHLVSETTPTIPSPVRLAAVPYMSMELVRFRFLCVLSENKKMVFDL